MNLNKCFYTRWLHSGHYNSAASLECHSCERFLSGQNIKDLMHDKSHGGFIVVDVNKPVGYIIYKKINLSNKVVIEIVNLVVHKEYRRSGIGSLLLNKVISRKNCKNLLALVRESNLSAQLFFKNNSFVLIGTKQDYFKTRYKDELETEDAYLFSKCVDIGEIIV